MFLFGIEDGYHRVDRVVVDSHSQKNSSNSMPKEYAKILSRFWISSISLVWAIYQKLRPYAATFFAHWEWLVCLQTCQDHRMPQGCPQSENPAENHRVQDGGSKIFLSTTCDSDWKMCWSINLWLKHSGNPFCPINWLQVDWKSLNLTHALLSWLET